MTRPWLALALALGAGCGGNGNGPSDWAELARVQQQRSALYEVATLRDALTTAPDVVNRAAPGAIAIVGLDSVAAPEVVREVEAEAARLWARAAAGPGIRAVVYAYPSRTAQPDTADRWSRSAGFRGTLLPDLTDGRTCVALVPIELRWYGPEQPALARRWLESMLAPCLYYARFGAPGAAVRAWLEGTGYRGIQSVDWLVRPAAGVPDEYWWYQPGAWSDPMGWTRALALLPSLAFGSNERTPPYHLGANVVGCIAGRREGCNRAVMARELGPRQALGSIPGVAPRPSDQLWLSSAEIGPVRWTSELIRTRGDDRFERLWASDGDFATAFETVYGEPLDTSVLDWARVNWEGRLGRPPIRLGPSVGWQSVGSTVGWAALLLLLPMLGSRRRTLGD